MTTWSYKSFESVSPGRDGVTELEHDITSFLESLGPRAEFAQTAMTSIVDRVTRAVVYYPETALALPPVKRLAGWQKADANALADSADSECYNEILYQTIADMLNALPAAQAARSKIAATGCKSSYATVTIWYPTEVD